MSIEELKRLNGYVGIMKMRKQGANGPGANYRAREAATRFFAKTLENSTNIEETNL